jgi:acyl-CoA thioesterase-1
MLSVSKRVRLVAGLALCLAAAACNGDTRAESESKPPAPALLPSTTDERPKIVALGDSLTAGLGLVQTESYPGLLQARIDADGYEFEVINAGVSGDTSAGGLRRLDWVLKDDVRVLIVALGANDGLRGLSIPQMQNNLSQIIERAQERNIAVILAGMEAPPNYGEEYAASFRKAYADLARKYRVTFVPFLLAGVAGMPDLNQADGIHPTAGGTALVAASIWKALHPILDQIVNS